MPDPKACKEGEMKRFYRIGIDPAEESGYLVVLDVEECEMVGLRLRQLGGDEEPEDA